MLSPVFLVLFVTLLSLAAMPSDVRGEMHRTAIGWAAWLPRRNSYCVAAAIAVASMWLMIQVALDPQPAAFAAAEILLALGALSVGLFSTSRPPAVVVRHEGVQVRHLRSV